MRICWFSPCMPAAALCLNISKVPSQSLFLYKPGKTTQATSKLNDGERTDHTTTTSDYTKRTRCVGQQSSAFLFCYRCSRVPARTCSASERVSFARNPGVYTRAHEKHVVRTRGALSACKVHDKHLLCTQQAFSVYQVHDKHLLIVCTRQALCSASATST